MHDPRIAEIRELLPRAMTSDWVRLGSRLVRLLRDQLHASRHEPILERLLAQARASVELREQRAARVPRVSYPPELPISPRAPEIVEAIRQSPVVVVAGETGSGKTTQIPKMCLEAGLGIEGRIGCTQPRRVAALSVSQRVAEELNVDWGREVGCKIRFDDRSSPSTFIKFMTDGILLAETQGDSLLTDYNAIIIDEAHERSLNIDFLLGYLKGLLSRRPELKLVITSATINTRAFSEAFNNAPIIEVSGRVYPVGVVYAPLTGDWEGAADATYIDAAVAAVQTALEEPGGGDVLVFVPGERDIRETSDALRAATPGLEIIPLYGRLGSGDQQKAFAPSPRRKVIVATNIAETSLTIPGIRFVVDSGLARISRYNPRTRTRHLPIEPISQSSANQRKGRSGRVREGLCIRLYSEEDFLARPEHTQPEIQRANLAEVILRMKAFRLGEIESFPFLNPPTPAAIAAGYGLLQELGALDDQRELTPLGRDLARLPIDPTLGRMLLQSHHEHATRELLIIASGLSIQDPRERPLDKKDAAAAAHKRYVDARSDFLTLLNLWNAFHEEWEKLATQSQRRKFCRQNFLSYTRMREWQDLHAQLEEALEDLGNLRLNESNAAYEAVHRSILAGLLGHVAHRVERNTYKGVGSRNLALFPGSALYDRSEPRKKQAKAGQPSPAPREAGSGQPEWVVAGEIVETSQVFARTVAGIDPLWIPELGPHLCKVAYENPRWDPAAGQVLATERTHFFGLEVRNRSVAYGNINPVEATSVFIRGALVEEQLTPESPEGRAPARSGSDPSGRRAAVRDAMLKPDSRPAPARFAFLEHNRKVRHKVETWLTRMRRRDLPDLDDALHAFYSARISNVSSFHELRRFLASQPEQFLFVTEQDLTGGREVALDSHAFPDKVVLQGQEVPLSYAYTPGEEQDGVTLHLSSSLVKHSQPSQIQWAVPGLRELQVAELLRGLPKTLRRELMPLPEKAAVIARELRPHSRSLAQDLSAFVRKHFGVDVPPASWSFETLPTHLRPRVEVRDASSKTIALTRALDDLHRELAKTPVKAAPPPDAWKAVADRFERFGLTQWNFGDVPETVEVSRHENKPVCAYPGLQIEEGQVNLRLFGTEAAAREASRAGFQRLLELALQKDLAWMQKDLRILSRLDALLTPWIASDQFQADAAGHLTNHLLRTVAGKPRPLKQAVFQEGMQAARQLLPGLPAELAERLEPILKVRAELCRRLHPVRPALPHGRSMSLADFQIMPAAPVPRSRPELILEAELGSLVPPHFLRRTTFERLKHLPRYLKALQLRLERAMHNPTKDLERSRQVAPYATAAVDLLAKAPAGTEARKLAEEFRWLVEEFKVSVFAQELGTVQPVSPKRLDEFLLVARAQL